MKLSNIINFKILHLPIATKYKVHRYFKYIVINMKIDHIKIS